MQTTPDLRLSRIETHWSIVGQAHNDDTGAADSQRQLLERYGGSVRRYLLAATRNADAADEVFQEFAVRFLRGGLRGADRGRGRFRDYVKGMLFHLITDFHRKAKKRLPSLSPDHPEPAAPTPQADEAFRTSWRDELLSQAWSALLRVEKMTGHAYFTVLRCRADHPEASSSDMAAQLRVILGKPLTAAGVRQTLHRAREKFADLLLAEIAQALANPTDEQIAEELVELGLMEHCRPALERRVSRA